MVYSVNRFHNYTRRSDINIVSTKEGNKHYHVSWIWFPHALPGTLITKTIFFSCKLNLNKGVVETVLIAEKWWFRWPSLWLCAYVWAQKSMWENRKPRFTFSNLICLWMILPSLLPSAFSLICWTFPSWWKHLTFFWVLELQEPTEWRGAIKTFQELADENRVVTEQF